MVDALVSNTNGFGRAGSTPALGTTKNPPQIDDLRGFIFQNQSFFATSTDYATMSVGRSAKPAVTLAKSIGSVAKSVVTPARSADCLARSADRAAKPVETATMSVDRSAKSTGGMTSWEVVLA